MLKRVSIQNFKSLKDVTLDLQKVNLLIGPNNSGKTNFLKALTYFRNSDFLSQQVGTLQDVSYKHQLVNVKYVLDYELDKTTSIFEKFNHKDDYLFHYIFELSIKDEEGYIALGVENKIQDWFINGKGEKSSTEVLGGHRREFFDFIKTEIFRPDPSKLLQQVKFSAEQVYLLPDCSNLISFYFYVDANFKKNSKSIQDNLSKCIPEIAYFTTPPVKVGNESLLSLRFFDKEDNGYWADEVSEGVLYFLSLLCIINQPNPPKLLLLEEPEKGIHPRRIFEVIQFILRLAEEKDVQVIMTTHSPTVVDLFKDMPESVFIFDKDEEGATHVKNLQKDVIEPETEESKRLNIEPPHYTSSLGNAWTVGFLGGVPK